MTTQENDMIDRQLSRGTTPYPRVERLQLRVDDKGDLHGYIFSDDAHALRWLSQYERAQCTGASRYIVSMCGPYGT